MKKLLLSLLFSLFIINGTKANCRYITSEEFNEIVIGSVIDIKNDNDELLNYIENFCYEIASQTMISKEAAIMQVKFLQPYETSYVSMTVRVDKKGAKIVSKYQHNIIR